MSTVQTEPTRTRDGFLQSFKSHPASVGESYFGHLRFALRFSGRLSCIAGAALVHAFIPAWFETTASDQITAMYEEMQKRKSGH